MKILDFIYAKIEESYVRRGYAHTRALGFLFCIMVFAFMPLIAVIMGLLSSIVPDTEISAAIAVAAVCIPTYLFIHLRYGRTPEGYYDFALDEYPQANRKIKYWIILFLPVVILFFWLAVLFLFSIVF